MGWIPWYNQSSSVLCDANRLESRYFITTIDEYGDKERYMFCDRLDALVFAFNKAAKNKNVTFKRQLYAIY